MFETMFRLADDTERITIAPKPGEIYRISFTFKDRGEWKEFSKALHEATKEQAKMRHPSTLDAIIVLTQIGALVIFIIMVIYVMITTLS